MITCRVLHPYEIRRYEFFLKERNLGSRSMYFGYAIPNDSIEKLVQDMIDTPSKHRVIVAEDAEQDIVGTIHIASMSESEVELGVMVAESHRGHGISSTMMDYAITWCQNRGLKDIYMHCLSYNQPILHLVKKHGLEVSKDFGDADARVKLPTPNMFTLGKEAMYHQSRLFQKNVTCFKKMLTV